MLLLCTACIAQQSQDFEQVTSQYSDKVFSVLEKKACLIGSKLDKQTNKYLARLKKRETILQKKLWKKDSVLAKELFKDVESKYQTLSTSSDYIGKYSAVYSGRLDTLVTSLNFLKQNTFLLSFFLLVYIFYKALPSR